MRRHFPIRIVIPAVFLLIAAAMATIELMDLPRAMDAVEERAVRSDVTFRMNRLEMTLERMVAIGNMADVQKEISAFGVDTNIKWLFLIDYSDTVAASMRLETVGLSAKDVLGRFVKMDWDEFSTYAAEVKKTSAGKAYMDERRHLVNGFFPVYYNEGGVRLRPQMRGFIFIQYDFSEPMAHELNRTAWKIAMEGIFIGGVIVLTGLFLYFTLARRARRLAATAERFSTGDMDARTMMGGGDELGMVAMAFDRMAGSVAAYQRHLKENEELLKKSEARFRNMVETTGDWVWEIDANMTYAYTSPRVFDLLGYTTEELAGKSFLDLMPPEEQKRFMEYFEPIAASKAPFFLFEHTKLSKDGRPLVFESTGVPVLDDAGNLLGYRGIGRDVTERKRLENIWRSRLRIVEFADSHPMDELLQKTLDELERLTGSTIGFYHFLEADQNTLSLQNWSTNTLKTMCTATGKGQHYNIADAGVWVDCVHQRRPVIHNDYKSLPHRKGMPEGHAPVERELVVPIFRGGSIVAIIGIGNKPRDYDNGDIAIVSQVGDVSWDIVEGKLAEEALRRANAYNRSLIEASLDPLVTIGPDGKITDVNAATETVTGYPRVRLVGTDFAAYFTEPERARAGYQRVFREGWVSDYGLEIRHSCGKTAHVLYNATVYRDEAGKVIGVFAAARDVTERKRAEEALRKNNEILERIFAATYFCVVYLDRDFNFIRVNTAYAKACGYPPEYFQGKNHFQLYPNEENEALFREVVSSGKPFTATAKPFVFSDHPEWGVTYWDWTLYPLKDAGGAVEALLFVLLDVTVRKKAEEALKLYQGHLEELVKKRTGELEAANLRLKELDQLKSMFIASMSHELRTPLNTIIGFVGIILQGMTGDINAEQRKQLTMVQDSSRHLLDLINDVIDISKIEANKVDLSIERFDLASLVKKIAESFAAFAGAKGVRLSIAAPERLLIESDTRRIRQIMVNLLGNALKFTDSGGINVSMKEADGRVNIVVADTGIGISESDMRKLFESFSQITVSGRPKEGSGLGLYLTKKIIGLLGGEIRVDSAVGAGSAFTVSLPLKYERR